MAITIQPLLWNDLSNLDDNLNIDDSDEKCLEEIKVSSGKIRSRFKVWSRFVAQVL